MIENMITELTMLGTGNATVTKCYNTCFTIKIGKNILLVDAGGGNGILRQLEKAGIAISEIHDMFVTHAHTDPYIGGCLDGPYRYAENAVRTIYGHFPGVWT